MSKEEDECKDAGYDFETYIKGEQPSRFKDKKATGELTLFNEKFNVRVLRITRYVVPFRKHDKIKLGKIFIELEIIDECKSLDNSVAE